MKRTIGGGLLILVLSGVARVGVASLLPSASDGLRFGVGIWAASLLGGALLFFIAPRDALGFTRPAPSALLIALGLSVGLTALFDGARWLTSGQLIPVEWKTMMNAPGAVVLALAVIVAAPLFEEAFFRGFLQAGLTPRLGATATIALSSMLFMLAHAPSDAIGALDPLLSGIALGLLRHRTGSLVPGIAFHALGNTQAVALALTL